MRLFDGLVSLVWDRRVFPEALLIIVTVLSIHTLPREIPVAVVASLGYEDEVDTGRFVMRWRNTRPPMIDFLLCGAVRTSFQILAQELPPRVSDWRSSISRNVSKSETGQRSEHTEALRHQKLTALRTLLRSSEAELSHRSQQHPASAFAVAQISNCTPPFVTQYAEVCSETTRKLRVCCASGRSEDFDSCRSRLASKKSRTLS